MDYTTVKAHLISSYNRIAEMMEKSVMPDNVFDKLDADLRFVSDLIDAAHIQPKKPTMLDYLWKWSSKKK